MQARRARRPSTVTLFQPVRFMLASPVETAAEAFERMGADEVWTEEKYDGVRCQLHHDDGRVELFSRDLKETTGAFPELAEAAPRLGHDVLFDGEVLAHRDGKVLRFFELQRRLGRKKVTDELRREVPVVLVDLRPAVPRRPRRCSTSRWRCGGGCSRASASSPLSCSRGSRRRPAPTTSTGSSRRRASGATRA